MRIHTIENRSSVIEGDGDGCVARSEAVSLRLWNVIPIKVLLSVTNTQLHLPSPV